MDHASATTQATDTSTSGTMVNDQILRNDSLMLQLGDVLFVGGALTGKRFTVDAISAGDDPIVEAAQVCQLCQPAITVHILQLTQKMSRNTTRVYRRIYDSRIARCMN